VKRRIAGFVSVTLGAVGCGEPARPPAVDPQALFRNDLSATDSRRGEAWRKYLQADQLHRAWAPPAGSPWRPYYKPTLVAAVAVVHSAARPVRSVPGSAAEGEADQFARTATLENSAVFVDLPGEPSVVWAMALLGRGFRPVLTINNWPHQHGILELEKPLGALLYFAEEMSQAGPALAADAPPVFILEGSRLRDKILRPDPARFDNRFFYATTDFPPASRFREKGISRVFYVNPRGQTAANEEDDLTEYFLSLHQAGIAITYIRPLKGEVFQADVVPVRKTINVFTPAETARYASGGSYHRHYTTYYHNYYRPRSSGTWGESRPSYTSSPSRSSSSGSSRSIFGGGSS
jgi:hypothetical protein